jgi:hypothetical protein
MLRRVALVRADVSKEYSVSIIRAKSVHRLLVTTNVVPSSPILVALMMEKLSSSETSVLTLPSSPILVALMVQALSSSEMSVLTRAKKRNIP